MVLITACSYDSIANNFVVPFKKYSVLWNVVILDPCPKSRSIVYKVLNGIQ